MRAVARVNLGAISSNVRVLRARVNVPLMAVVKADAYGHGLVPVARAALDGVPNGSVLRCCRKV